MNILCIGDAMIRGSHFKRPVLKFSIQNNSIMVNDWEDDWDRLQHRRLVIEKQTDAEPVLPMIQHADTDRDAAGLICPVSAEAMDALPHLRVIGGAPAWKMLTSRPPRNAVFLRIISWDATPMRFRISRSGCFWQKFEYRQGAYSHSTREVA